MELFLLPDFGGQQEDTVSPILSQPVSYLGAQVGNRMLLTVHLLLRQESPGSWVLGPFLITMTQT